MVVVGLYLLMLQQQSQAIPHPFASPAKNCNLVRSNANGPPGQCFLEPECKEVCKTEDERQCSIVDRQECTTVSEQVCNTETRQDCNTINEKQCETVIERKSGFFNLKIYILEQVMVFSALG